MLNFSSTFKDAQNMVEESINTEINASSQWRFNFSSVSGSVRSSPDALSTQDTSVALPNVLPLGTISWPEPLLAVRRKPHMHSLTGVFSSFFRAWFTVDNQIFLWDYRAKGEYCLFDDIPDIIVSVGTPVAPHCGVFQTQISYLLPVATSTMVLLLGVTVSDANGRKVQLVNVGYGIQAPTVITSIQVAEKDGRIFCGGADGNIYEVLYNRGVSPFTQKMSLIPYSFLFSTTPIIGQLSAAVLSLKQIYGQEKPAIKDLVIVVSGSLLISLDDQSTLTVWGLLDKGLKRYSALPHRPSRVNSTSDPKSNPLVRLCLIDPDQDDCNLVAVALNGEQFRYRYSTGSYAEISLRAHIPLLSPCAGEISVCGATGFTMVIAMGGQMDQGGEGIFAVSAARHAIQPHTQVRDVIAVLDSATCLRSGVEAVESVQEREHIASSEMSRQVTRFPNRFLLAHRLGLSLYMICRPVDTLRMILAADASCRDSLLKRFSSSFNGTDYCAMLLQLAIGVSFVVEKDYDTFHSESLSSIHSSGNNHSSLVSLGSLIRQNVSPEVQRSARQLLRQWTVPEIKESSPMYGQKTVAVTLSSFSSAVIVVMARALFGVWNASLEKVSATTCVAPERVLEKLIQFLGTVEVGKGPLESAHVPYPTQWKGNRISVTVPENYTISLTDATNLQMIVLNCCFQMISHSLQALTLLRQLGCASLLSSEKTLSLLEILHDREKAQKIGERIASHLLFGGLVVTTERNALRTVSLLKRDCPYFFTAVDVSEFQAQMELKDLCAASNGLRSSKSAECAEWVARIVPCASQYWVSGSLETICRELASAQRDDLAVQLLLHAAHQLDPDLKAFSLYAAERSGQRVKESVDASTYGTYENKLKVLQCIIRCLEKAWFHNHEVACSLLGGPKRSGSIWAVEPADEMSHFYLFEWLCAPREDAAIQRALKDILVAARSPHLQKFLSMNASSFGEQYTRYLRVAQGDHLAAMKEGLSLAQSDLAHLPERERLGYRIRCLSESLECARECGSDQAQLLEKRLQLLSAQQSLLRIILEFRSSPLFSSQRPWNNEGGTVTEGELVDQHLRVVSGNVLSPTEILRIAAMYPRFGGAEVQLDVLLSSNVHDPSTYALCIRQAYEARGSSLEEITRRLLKKYYTSSTCFSLTVVIRVLEAEECLRSPEGSSRTVQLLLDCHVDPRVVRKGYESLLDRTDQTGVMCNHLHSENIPESFLLYSLAVVSVVVRKMGSSTSWSPRTTGGGDVTTRIKAALQAGVSTNAEQIALQRAIELVNAV